MKKTFSISAFSLLFFMILSFKKADPSESVAVIELFTSQGCSSCPPADLLLSQTIADAKKDGRKIFALSFHVDYWNRLGWADPFSDKKYSERQTKYAAVIAGSSVYTPQMIVNGNTQFVGSDKKELNNALSKSLAVKPTVIFKSLTVTAGKVSHVQYTLEGDFSGCKINFALISLSETTQVNRGENGGRTLKNENVVRQFISEPAKATGEISFSSFPFPENNNMAIIAYVQRNNDSKIIGAEMTKPEQ